MDLAEKPKRPLPGCFAGWTGPRIAGYRLHVDQQVMNTNSAILAPDSPILLIPYMWIGDFVRCHSVVRLLNERWPNRPVDVLTTTLCAPLLDYMPGVRKGIVCDLPRQQLAFAQHKALAERFSAEHYGSALVMPRTWKSALAPWLAGIPERTGFAGEFRFGLLNDVRFGEKKLPRMIDRCGALTLPKGTPVPKDWPKPDLKVPVQAAAEWRARRGLDDGSRPVIAFAPGAVGPSKRWPVAYFGELARTLTAEGFSVWVLGSPAEAPLAAGDRRCRGSVRARPHLQRPSQCDPGAEGRQRLRLQRLRPGARLRRHRHADRGHLRADQRVALGAAQPARRHHRDADRCALPPVPQAGLPLGASPLHARHPGLPGASGGAPRARQP